MENVMVVVLTPDEVMKEFDKNLEKACEIMGLFYRNYGIKLNDDEFYNAFDIINK